MLKSLGTRRARLLAAALVVATLTAGCFGGGSTTSAREVPLPPSGLSREIYDLVNADRGTQGLPALTWHPKLGGLAQGWSEHMASTREVRAQRPQRHAREPGVQRVPPARGEHPGRQLQHDRGRDGAGVDELTRSPRQHPRQLQRHWSRRGLRRRASLGNAELRRGLTAAERAKRSAYAARASAEAFGSAARGAT